MRGFAFGGWLMAVVCGALGGCGAGGVQDKAAAPIGSWKGTLATFDVRSDGQVSYKDPGVAEFTGRWEWLPSNKDQGTLVLTPSAASSAKPLQLPMIWLNKNALKFCDANSHCDTLSRR
jgi:hypothetical protein